MVTLPASSGYFKAAKYQIEFSKRGLATQNVPLTADIDGWYFGNILFGGPIGMLIVDPATGAMWKLPDNVNANASPIATLSSENGKAIKLVDKNSIPAGLQTQLIALR